MLRPAAGLRVHTTPAAPAFPCARPLTVRDPSSPASRHSHASVVVSSEEGLLYIFGGILDEPVVSSDEPQPGKVANDIWAYDMASQGWEEVPFEKSQLGCDLPAESQQVKKPPARAGHKMVSRRTGAITCGGHGYADDGRTKTLLSAQGKMDCWWFTPGSPPRWDALNLDKSSAAGGPEPRYAHSMSYDPDADRIIVFGGKTANGALLDDCWALSEVATTTYTSFDTTSNETVLEIAALEYRGTYKWSMCGPAASSGASTNGTSLKPQARYGHQSVYFAQSLYVVGGYAEDGLRVVAKQDIWLVDLVHENGKWSQLMPATETPPSRGFHALWLSGYKIILHGGQGPSGSGFAAVLSDTWEFDLFSNEWQQKASSSAVPVMSHLAINPLQVAGEFNKAISFGGRDQEGNPSGRLYQFSSAKATDAWKRLYPAGVSPSRRTGHALVFEQSSARIIISFGMGSNGMQQDTWVLDLATRMWKCHYGSDPSCEFKASNAADAMMYRGPGEIAFASQIETDMYSFLFGGAKVEIKTCAEMKLGVKGNIAVAANVLDMWAMDISRLSFLKVVLDKTVPNPTATFLSSMAATAEIDGFKRPAVLVGGADLSCVSKNPPCTMPTPSNEIWIMDTALKESAGTRDKMAELDGVDDIIQVVLPSWCKSVTAMNVLWIDAWIMVVSTGKVSE